MMGVFNMNVGTGQASSQCLIVKSLKPHIVDGYIYSIPTQSL